MVLHVMMMTDPGALEAAVMRGEGPGVDLMTRTMRDPTVLKGDLIDRAVAEADQIVADLIGGSDHNRGPTADLAPNRSQERKKKRGVLDLDRIPKQKQMANTKQVLE